MTRWKAFALHLAPTMLVAAGIAALFVLLWYPPPLFKGSGSARLLGTILLTLLVTGPLLTLLVFKKDKKGLKFDLFAILLLQSATLAYGLFVAFQTRPVYIAVLPYRATLVRLDQLEQLAGQPAQAAAPLWGPEPVGVRMPAGEERQRLIAGLFKGKRDVDFRAEFHGPLAGQIAQITREAVPLQERLAARDASSLRYEDWLKATGRTSSENLYLLPLILPNGEAELILDAGDAAVAGYLASPAP